jgi:hypothetical protein
MFNPWMVLADHPGPKPFFETLNDESGRRYVIGEGGFVHFLVFAEDDDRESPTYDPNTGEGIYPESL